MASTLASNLEKFKVPLPRVALLARVPFEGALIVPFDGALIVPFEGALTVPFQEPVLLEPALTGGGIENAVGEAVLFSPALLGVGVKNAGGVSVLG